MDSTRSAQQIDHLTALAAVTDAMARALETVPPDGRPAALATWTTRDVGVHLTAVHRWATQIVRTGHRPPRTNRIDLPGTLAAAYRASADELLATLQETDPSRACWTLDRTDRTVRFWRRRQLHEALVHLWDVRSAAASGGTLLEDHPAELCADGVDEFLQVFPPRIGPSSRRPLPGPLLLRATDVPAAWRIAPDWSIGPAERDAAATVRASAGALLLFVWGRPVGPAVETSGDTAVVAGFLRAQCRA